LTRALKQKVQLSLQRRGSRVAIEALKKRIFICLLENQFAAEALRQTTRKTCLSHTDWTFDDDVAVSGR
jgi:hypothetical protein